MARVFAPEPGVVAFLKASEAEQQALEAQEAARQRELEETRQQAVAAFLKASEAERLALVEQEAARLRDLEAARQLAEQREQTATVLRRRARILVGVMFTTFIAALTAIWFGIRAEQAKNQAQKAQDEALVWQSLYLADLARQ